MSASMHILWATGLLVSVLCVLITVGDASLIAMFPEGRRWWHWPSRVLALAFFAAMVLHHPFGSAT